MPVGTLRGKGSTQELYRPTLVSELSGAAHSLPPNLSLTPNISSKVADRPQSPSLISPIRPSTSHRSTASPRPDLIRRPSSPRSTQNSNLDVPRTRQSLKSASEPDIATKFRVQAHKEGSTATTDSDAAPSPTIGSSNVSRDEANTPKLPRRLTVRPFGSNLKSLRSASYNAMFPKSRVSDVGSQPQPQIWKSHGDDSSAEDLGGTTHIDKAGPSPLRYSESSAVTGDSNKTPSARPSATVGSRASQFFKFTRRKKQPESLFPLPVRVSPPSEPSTKAVSIASSESPTHTQSIDEDIPPVPPIPSSATTSAFKPSLDLGRNESITTPRASPAVTSQFPSNVRSRANTTNSSSGRPDSDRAHTPYHQDSGRNSTASTTLGRNSIAGLRSLTSRLRHPSDVYTPRHSPGGLMGQSVNNSFALSRETLALPDHPEGESAGKYYQRLEEQMPKRHIALALCKSSEPFNRDVMRSLLRTFKFFEEPIDLSMRKFLWEVNLPGEAQQIDRVINAFAERYHECNPHIFSTIDQAEFIAYSMIILHSDLFNPNNKTKMQRHQYQRNTSDHTIPQEILGYFYDNIVYTEFIGQNADEDDAKTQSKSASKKARRVKQKLAAPETAKNGKVDPYVVIIDDKYKLDTLRSVLKDTLSLEDTYSYFGTANRFEILRLRAAFARFGTLQITSSMSRPEAFKNEETKKQAAPGVVDIKVAKVGIVYRKNPKRKRTRSPWQPWGAILTPSQLMFFRNADWVKGLVHQVEVHQKQPNNGAPCVFKPPLASLTFEGKVATNDAVALVDASYRKHKNAFILARRGFAVGGSDLGQNHFEETLYTDTEGEMNDWVAKFNYASTFMTSNVKMHSWHPGCKVEDVVETSDQEGNPKASSEMETQAEVLHQEQQKTMTPAAKASLMRARIIKEKLASAEKELPSKLKTVEDHVRTARHLEILAPLNDRSRSELLSFGARLAHNIRWSRFDVARLKCHREMLNRELSEDESTTSTRGMGILDSEDRIFGLDGKQRPIRRNSRSEPPIPEQALSDPKRAALRTVKSEGDDRRPNSYRSSDIFESIDEAFATPPETLATVEGASAGNFKLLNLSSHASLKSPDSPDVQSANSPRPSSISSISSRPQAPPGSATPTPSLHEPEEERRPSTASDADVDVPKTELANSPTSSHRSKAARRSLQRTLREPRDALAQSASRSTRIKKHRDRDSKGEEVMDDSASAKGVEGITRRRGSFTVHGKKASVITIPEWDQQAKSTEERLRLRKQLVSDSAKRRSADIDGMTIDGTTTEDEEGSIVQDRRGSVAVSTSVAEESGIE